MEVESVQSAEIIKNVEGTGRAENAEIAKIDVSEEFVEFLTLTTDTMEKEAWDVSQQVPSKVVRTIEANMNRLYQSMENSSNAKPDDSMVLAQVYLQMSMFYHNPCNKKEKLYIAEAYLTRCLKLLKDKKLDRKAIIIAMTAYFELSCLWYKLENLEKSKRCINEVLELYKSYTQGKDDYPVPICILTVIGQSTERHLIKLDEIYWKALCSLTLFLRQSLEQTVKDKNIIMCMHKVLKKYLKIVPSIMGRLEWTEHAIALGRLLLASERFAEAKSHIAAAAFMVDQFYDEECAKADVATSPEKHVALNEVYIHEICKVNMSWAWYGIALLAMSKERLTQDNVVDKPREATELQSVSATKSEMPMTKLQFTDLEEELRNFIALAKDTYVTNYIDAETIFQAVLNSLNKIRIHVKKKKDLELYTDYIRCTSKAYKYLAYYERQKDNLIKLHKKRIAALYDIMNSFYATDDGYLYGYISLELAIATSTLLDVQVDNLPIDRDPMSSLEIKELVNKNIQNLKLYLHHIQ